MSALASEQRIAEMRRFNRFYTQKIGVLDEGLLRSRFSLAEARVLYELAYRDSPSAGEIARDLHLDPGYLSRILRGFRRQGLIDRTAAAGDGRRRHLSLTEAGYAVFAPLDAGSRVEIETLLGDLSEPAQASLIAAMRTIERLIGAVPDETRGLTLRFHRAGDLGWIVSQHGALYAREYCWDARFEAMVAQIVVRFVEHFDASRERCWIAEQDGKPVGSVALVAETAEAARLRLLFVEPTARGHGLGGRLIAECLDFARQVGYRRIVLSTFSVLDAARRLYEAAGFRRASTEAQCRFGHDLVEEAWELVL